MSVRLQWEPLQDALSDLRTRGLESFHRQGLPRDRYSDLTVLPLEEFSLWRAEEVDLPSDCDAVVQDGALAIREGLPVEIFPVLAFADRYPGHFLGLLDVEEDGLMGLHVAYVQAGFGVRVPAGTQLEKPLRIRYLQTQDATAGFVHLVVVLEEGAQADLVEEVQGNPGRGLLSHALEVYAGPRTRFSVSTILEGGGGAWYYGQRRVRVDEEAEGSIVGIWMGRQGSRVDTRMEFVGAGSRGEDVQVFFTTGDQLLHLRSTLNHRNRQTYGEVEVRGVLRDRSRSVFEGMLRILPEGNTSSSFQQAHTILLNRGARADSIPGLEILADEVRCTHAATTGPIDESQLFYLRTRGLPEDLARQLIVEGFLEPALRRMPSPELRERVLRNIKRKWSSSR